MRSLASVVALLWLVLAGCEPPYQGGCAAPFGGPPDASPHDAGPSDAGPPDAGPPDAGSRDGGCIDECPGTYACGAGVVYAYQQDDWITCTCAQVPIAQCARGCSTGAGPIIHAGSDEDALVLCEENRPKQLGDPCSAPEDCQPEVAVVDPIAHTIQNVYLRCDLEQHQCVAREPTVVGDWLATCGVAQDIPVDVGAVEAPACSGGLCLVARRDGCLRQGCTVRCAADGECPVDALCYQGACRPPSWIDLGTVLTCPAP